MAIKPYVVEKKINGKTYKAVFSGMSAALRALDNSYINVDGNNVTSIEKLANYLFENVITEPANLSIDDFDDMTEFNEVVSFAREVMQGEFRNKKVEKSAKAEGEE